MRRRLLHWLLFVAVVSLPVLAFGVISGTEALKTPVVAVVQILADATSALVLVAALRRGQPDRRQRSLLWLLFAAYLASLVFTVSYHAYATLLDKVYPNWTVVVWIVYLVFVAAFWCRGLRYQVVGNPRALFALRRVAVIVGMALLVAHALHLQDLFAYREVDSVRRGIYGVSGIVEALAAIVLCVSALMFRKFGWVQALSLTQLGLIQLDLVFCSVEFNDVSKTFVTWPWETAWAACQWASAWILVRHHGNLKPLAARGDADGAPPRNVLRGRVANVALVAGAFLAALTYFVTSANSWHAAPLLRGQGVALSVLTFIAFMIFVVPNLVFDDGELQGAESKLATIVFHFGEVIMGNLINQGNMAMGHGRVENSTVTNTWSGLGNGDTVAKLAEELALLRSELRRSSDNSAEQDAAIGAVAAAERAARKGDGQKALDALKGAGKWVFDIAEKIGVAVAASALKSALGLP